MDPFEDKDIYKAFFEREGEFFKKYVEKEKEIFEV